jgi:hypothetical protein
MDFASENWDILWVQCHSIKASIWGSFARHSCPILGGAEGEIHSAYSILVLVMFFSY